VYLVFHFIGDKRSDHLRTSAGAADHPVAGTSIHLSHIDATQTTHSQRPPG
jgi:hypothetical protein